MAKIRAVIVCVALMLAVPAFATQPGSITKIELRSAPPEETNARLRDLVWSMFERQDFRRKARPRAALVDVFLRTRKTATHVVGLCRYDSVRVDFEPKNSKELGPRAPARPVGLRTTSYFAFRTPPGDWYESIYVPTRNGGSACAKMSDEAYFTAEDEEVASDATYAWLLLQGALNKGESVPLKCDFYPTETITCAQLIRSLAATHINDAEACDADEGAFCYRVSVNNRSIDIDIDRTSSEPQGIVKAARLKSYIVLADQRMD